MDDDLFDVFSEPVSSRSKRKVAVPAAATSGSESSKRSKPVEDSAVKIATELLGEKKKLNAVEGFVAPEPIVPLPSSDAEMKPASADGAAASSSALSVDDSVTTPGAKEILFAELAGQTKTCTHEVAFPPNWTGPDPRSVPLPDRPAAKEYPFTLDPFQRESVTALEKGQSVLVSAHTSAGKTAVAEYAIAMALRDQQRVVYTSPIKALSNQKYRELQEEFKDVGLMTGDVTISPNASCLVMTTEILRSMLYRGSEVLREVAWVIFDEVHYMRDKARGVVWEETMILLPDKVRYVFLSATIPNAFEFAGWIAKLHQQPVHVVYTDYRPTPLQHYVFPMGGDGIYLIVDEKGRFREDNLTKAMSSLQQGADVNNSVSNGSISGGRSSKEKDGAAERGKGGGKGAKQQSAMEVYKVVKMIMDRHYEPVIIFSFSKRECENYALMMGKLDFNDEDEKKLVEAVFKNAIESLAEEDRSLPQIEHILPLLKKGIGIHHSGLLPIIKEVIEILFQEGLIKALFSTETFSMGLNMPAKTVVFTSVSKFDGKEQRLVSSGEYIQMSGRAGRRGLDERGIVIMMAGKDLDTDAAKKLLNGRADPLNSTFHLSYNMLLNLLRVEEINPEYMIRRSFHQFQAESARPEMEKVLAELIKKRDELQVLPKELAGPENENVAREVGEYCLSLKKLDALKQQVITVMQQPSYMIPFIQAGRLVKIREKGLDWGYGVVVSFKKLNSSSAAAAASSSSDATAVTHKYTVDVLIPCDSSAVASAASSMSRPLPALSAPSSSSAPLVVSFTLNDIQTLSAVRVHMPGDLARPEMRQAVALSLQEVVKRFPDGLPSLDPIEDLKIKDPDFKKSLGHIESLEAAVRSKASSVKRALPAGCGVTFEELQRRWEEKDELDRQAVELQRHLRATQSMVLKQDLKNMMRVLRRLGCVTEDNVIDTKGRVACEISTADELLMTELIFNGAFNSLTPEQCVALISCTIFDEKTKDATITSADLQKPHKALQDTARRIGKVCEESKITIDVEEYVNTFGAGIVEVVYAWCKGASFSECCKMTDVFEGSIVRAMRRLEEAIRQLMAAAKAVGDESLELKFSEGIKKMKRGIIFASSLYL